MTALDERQLFDELATDWTDATGCFGGALGAIYGMAIGCDAYRILEVGVNKGGSTRALLLAAKRLMGTVTSVDINPAVRDNVPADLHQWWHLIISRSQDLDWRSELDLLFLDGDHVYEVAKVELEKLGGHVRRGGLIIMDDCWPLFAGVLQAFKEYRDCKHKFLLPYGNEKSQPGGPDRTMGVIIR